MRPEDYVGDSPVEIEIVNGIFTGGSRWMPRVSSSRIERARAAQYFEYEAVEHAQFGITSPTKYRGLPCHRRVAGFVRGARRHPHQVRRSLSRPAVGAPKVD